MEPKIQGVKQRVAARTITRKHHPKRTFVRSALIRSGEGIFVISRSKDS